MEIFRNEISPLLRKPAFYLPFLLALAVVLTMAVDRYGSAHYGSDFHMYYTSGQHFSAGDTLYKNPDSGAPYVYPPFAAFLFQLLPIVQQGTAIALVFVLNFFLTLVNAGLIYAIARKTGYNRRQSAIGMGLALLFSVSDVWNNINFSQINPLIFFLILAGLYSSLLGRHNVALLLLAVGAWIKVLPVFFVFWVLARHFSLRRALVVAMVSVVCVGLPFLQRGPQQGLDDMVGYYDDFLRENMVDDVNTIWRNQSLSAAITRAFVPEENKEGLDYSWVDLGPATTNAIVKICSLGLFILSFGLVIRRARQGLPVTVFELGLIFLMTHLFSGVTWRGHLLTTFFMYLPFFLIRVKELKWPGKVFHFFLAGWLGLMVIRLRGTPLDETFRYLHGWSYVTWALLLLFVYYFYWAIKEDQKTLQARGHLEG